MPIRFILTALLFAVSAIISHVQDVAAGTLGSFRLDTIPPVVTADIVAGGAAQRSMVLELTCEFSKDISASLGVGDLILENLTTGEPIDPADMAVTYDPGTDAATWTFPGLEGGTLPDGNYTATLPAADITDAVGNLLDGDNNGTGGDDHVLEFFHYFGDGDGDRDVDFLDLLKFRVTFQKTLADNPDEYDFRFDVDMNGDVDFLDLFHFRVHFNTVLPASPQIDPGARLVVDIVSSLGATLPVVIIAPSVPPMAAVILLEGDDAVPSLSAVPPRTHRFRARAFSPETRTHSRPKGCWSRSLEFPQITRPVSTSATGSVMSKAMTLPRLWRGLTPGRRCRSGCWA